MKKIARIDFLFELLRVVLGLLIAYALTLVCIMFVAEDPGAAIVNFMVGPFQTKTRLGILMGKFIPYVLTGCGMCFVYSSGRFSLIGEGIVNFAPVIAVLLIFNTGGWMSGLPLFFNLLIILIVGGLVGGATAMVPAYGRERLGVNEMVIAVIMNQMLLFLSIFLIKRFAIDASSNIFSSKPFPDNIRFPRFFGSPIHAGIFVSIVGFIVACVLFYRTRVGLNIRCCGANLNFARYAGINTKGAMYTAHIIGGIFAGLAGIVDVFGLYQRYQYQTLTQIGMDGLVVAVLARKQPAFVPLSALVLAYIRASATVLNTSTNIPVEFVNIMQAVLIFFVAARQFLSKPKNAIIFNISRQNALAKEAK